MRGNGRIIRIGINRVKNIEPTKNTENEPIETIVFFKVTGYFLYWFLNLVKTENKRGNTVLAINKTEIIPNIDTKAIDLSAGCLAKISTPNAPIVVKAESSIDNL